MALGLRISESDSRVYVMLGDGEVQEGQIWEAAMAASHYRVDNICAILDRNSLQIDGSTEEVMAIEPIADKWASFGWNVLVIDGHNIFKFRHYSSDLAVIQCLQFIRRNAVIDVCNHLVDSCAAEVANLLDQFVQVLSLGIGHGGSSGNRCKAVSEIEQATIADSL